MSCFVYMIRSGYGNNRPIKIGMADDPKRRIKELQTGNPEVLDIVLTIRCNSRSHARLVERTLHDQLCGVNILGEWYRVRKEKLYKVLDRLASDSSCDVVEEFNLKTKVEQTRDMLRTERRRSEGYKKKISELESSIKQRKKRCGNYRLIIKELGYDDRYIENRLKEME